MKIFISYKFAEENQDELKEFMENIKSALEKSSHKVLTTFFNAGEFQRTGASMRKIMDTALGYIDNSELVLCIIKSPDKSEGMILEIGYAIAKKKKIILAVKEGLETRWIKEYASEIIKFKDMKELYGKLKKIK